METVMSEWGCPDWREAKNYNAAETWTNEQWRWEFRRRRPSIRYAFSILVIEDLQSRGKVVPKNYLWLEEYKSKSFTLNPSQAASFGYPRLPNPVYSDAVKVAFLGQNLNDEFLSKRTLSPSHCIAYKHGNAGKFDAIGIGQVAIVFDPSQPIKQQLEGLEGYLNSHRHHSIKHIERHHSSKWLRYLRILDARESGASWRQCAQKILQGSTAATPQTASDTFKQVYLVRDSL